MLLDADYILFHKQYANYVFFYKLNADCVFYPAVTGGLMSARPSPLWTLVAMVR
jgi:hypothetical protein